MTAETEKSPRLTPRQQERRTRILDAARRLTAEHGYDAVSMKTIAAESGVAEKTLYNIYATKARLLATAALEVSAQVFDLAALSAPDKSWDFFFALAGHMAEHTLRAPQFSRAVAPLMLEQPDLLDHRDMYVGHLVDVIEGMIAQGLMTAVPARRVVRLLRLSIISGVVLWARNELSDRELQPYLELGVGQILLPLAAAAHAPLLQQRIHDAGALLCTENARLPH